MTIADICTVAGIAGGIAYGLGHRRGSADERRLQDRWEPVRRARWMEYGHRHPAATPKFFDADPLPANVVELRRSADSQPVA